MVGRCAAIIGRSAGSVEGIVRHIDPPTLHLLACRWPTRRAHACPAHETTLGRGETIARFLLTRSPLGALVRRVAGLRASVHSKLLGAFLLIALLLVAMRS